MTSYIFGQHAVQAVLEHQSQRALKLIVGEGMSRDEAAQQAKKKGLQVQTWPKARFKEKFGAGVVHQGLALEVREFPYVDLESILAKKPSLCVVLDSIEDPRNLGRAARSAYALGAEALVIPKDRSADITATAEKAAVGALAKLPVVRVANLNRALEAFKKAGLWIIGSSDKASMPAWKCDLTKPVALVIGNEEKGLRRQVQENCDELLQIPMAEPGMSLNAADAVTVLLYEVLRQRS
ncbi:MAG: 23S rRNA (guanosine(2251)-2'-O)-methyltransferase RlmB [Deltaproteobacteria bacterium]|nr:23S rRNA (guanosine(2251)-2'-O)-methyltransferase RlmB [Deltaproteobacteria bacterium]